MCGRTSEMKARTFILNNCDVKFMTFNNFVYVVTVFVFWYLCLSISSRKAKMKNMCRMHVVGVCVIE